MLLVFVLVAALASSSSNSEESCADEKFVLSETAFFDGMLESSVPAVIHVFGVIRFHVCGVFTFNEQGASNGASKSIHGLYWRVGPRTFRGQAVAVQEDLTHVPNILSSVVHLEWYMGCDGLLYTVLRSTNYIAGTVGVPDPIDPYEYTKKDLVGGSVVDFIGKMTARGSFPPERFPFPHLQVSGVPDPAKESLLPHYFHEIRHKDGESSRSSSSSRSKENEAYLAEPGTFPL